MREILFRGKRLDNGEWVEGMLVDYSPDMTFIKHKKLMKSGLYCYDYTEIDFKTVGQFTGQLDKNGKMIYEGDVLKLHGTDLPHWYDDGQNVSVRYVLGGFEPLTEYDCDCGEYVRASECEVVGNVHDNPELLEG